MKKRIKYALLGAACLVACLAACAPAELGRVEEEVLLMEQPGRGEVALAEGFWSERCRVVREETLPYALELCENEGGKPFVWYRDPAYPCNTPLIEGASNFLAVRRDEALEARIDALFAAAAQLQDEDGYLRGFNTNYTSDHKFEKEETSHELYAAGHFIEAAVAYYRATGKTNGLDIAVRLADFLAGYFGYGKHVLYSGHQEVELALVKLYEAVGKAEYLRLAEYFVDVRGRGLSQSGKPGFGRYAQDHMPAAEQREAVGHTIRGLYQYIAMADLALAAGRTDYLDAVQAIFQDILDGKMYLTGGQGLTGYVSDGHAVMNESWTARYNLPLSDADVDTCTAVATVFLADRLNRITNDASYADVVEHELYNRYLAGFSWDGKRFSYGLPQQAEGFLSYDGGGGLWYSDTSFRPEWMDIPCCPPNIVRLASTLQTYAYAVSGNGIYLNQFFPSTARLMTAAGSYRVKQDTEYPGKGSVKLTFLQAPQGRDTLHIRIPSWTRGVPIPGAPYRSTASGKVSIKVNGRRAEYETVNGYALLNRVWESGDTVQIELPLMPGFVTAEPIADCQGMAALQRGPVVYALEGADNPAGYYDMELDTGKLSQKSSDLWGGCVLLTGTGYASGKKLKFTAIPYYGFDNRGSDSFRIWFPVR